jgi:hypothetical protein
MRTQKLQRITNLIRDLTGPSRAVVGPIVDRARRIVLMDVKNPILAGALLLLLLAVVGLGGLCAATADDIDPNPNPPPPAPQVFGPIVLCPGESWSKTLGPYRSNVVAGPASSSPAVATGSVTGGAGDVDVSDTITVKAHSPGTATISLTAEMWELDPFDNHRGGRFGVGHGRRGDISILVTVPDCTKKEKPKPTPTTGIPVEEQTGADVPTVDEYDHTGDDAPVQGPTGPDGGVAEPTATTDAQDGGGSPEATPTRAGAEDQPDCSGTQDECDGGTDDGGTSCEVDSGCFDQDPTPCDPCEPDTDDEGCHSDPRQPSCLDEEPTPTPTPEPTEVVECEMVDLTLCGIQSPAGDGR